MTDAQVKNIRELLKKSKKILLSTHINPDGDGIGTGLALMRKLLKMGKKVDFINRDPLPEIYAFLPGSSQIKNSGKITGTYDLAIVLECPELERNGNIIDYKRQAVFTVNIDHHPGNTMYGNLNIVDPKAAAVGEQIFTLMKKLKWDIDADMAACLYTAIETDTGSFRYSNTTPHTHILAAELLKLGADPEEISSHVYSTNVPGTRLLNMMLSKMRIEGKFGWSVLSRGMYKKTGAKESDTDNFINSIRSIRDVEIAVLFKETGRSTVKVSFRSKNGADVNVIARKFNGGGHKHAAGCVINLPLQKAVSGVAREIRKYYRHKKAK
ncbi:MAG: bifunctional oligoribonuclease/PAP phosphatase NrnA [Spirochaetia bacterium]|nr:bifunctional oligoribonuclease/PAP phosphatase NrnA [Spirochaetia bacterium]